MLTFAFVLAFSLLICSNEAVSQAELQAAFLLGDEVTVDVVCAWGKDRHQKQVLIENQRVIKVTGYKASFPCKGGATIEALGIPDEKHDELDFACVEQYDKPYEGITHAQPALNGDGAPFMSKSTLMNRLAKYCGILKPKTGILTREGVCMVAKEITARHGRSPKPLLGYYFTPGGEKRESFPEDC